MPGSASGRVTRREGPQAVGAERAGGVLETAVDRFDGEAHRPHHQRKPHDAAGERRPGPAKREHNPEMIGKERPQRRAAPQQHQQDIARHHRRQHQRQMDESVEQELAGKAPARQRIGRKDTERQAESGGRQRDLEGQPDRRPFIRSKLEHRLWPRPDKRMRGKHRRSVPQRQHSQRGFGPVTYRSCRSPARRTGAPPSATADRRGRPPHRHCATLPSARPGRGSAGARYWEK